MIGAFRVKFGFFMFGQRSNMKTIIAGNFKANLTRKQVMTYTQGLEKFLESQCGDSIENHKLQVDIFPSHTALLDNTFAYFHIGTQNGYFAASGGFTGEIGLLQLQEFGINRILIGHSERRNLLGEDSECIAKKFRFYAEAGFEIYYCIGEDLHTRQKGEGALKDFLHAQLASIDVSYSKLIVAYEPIWAIGTGVSASMEQIEETHSILAQMTQAPLLYGGSVNADNAGEILKIQNVNGVLVGSASLEVDSFAKIIQAAL